MSFLFNSGSGDSEHAVSTETILEYQSTYSLTKNLHLKKWNTSVSTK